MIDPLNLTCSRRPCPCAPRWAAGSEGWPFPLCGFVGGPAGPVDGGVGVVVARVVARAPPMLLGGGVD